MQSARPPQICNCSIAAARKVSAAARTTRSPCLRYCPASLAMVVVLPLPLTPATKMTCGFFPGSRISGLATGSRMVAIASASAPLTSSASTSLSKRDLAKSAASLAEVETPKSAVIRSSSSSSIAASSSLRLVKRSVIPPAIFEEDRLSPCFKRPSHPPFPPIMLFLFPIDGRLPRWWRAL